MATTITQIVGADEAVRLVCEKLARFAAPHKLPAMDGDFANIRRLGNVDIWFDPENAGQARFHAVTHDNIGIDVTVDFTELSSEYLADMVAGVRSEIDKHRGGRRHLHVVH